MISIRNTIFNGDCLTVLPSLPAASVNFVLTDPPYITRYKPRDGRTVLNDDNDAWLKPAFAEMYRVLQADGFCFTFYGWPHADRFMQAFRAAGFRPVGHFSFLKRHISSVGHVRSRHETAYLLAKGNPRKPLNPIEDVIEWNHNSGNRHHPTEKPVSVLLPLIQTYSQPDGLVCDPFTGSGSSLLAAKTLGRSYLGIELDADYHAIASKRLEQ